MPTAGRGRPLDRQLRRSRTRGCVWRTYDGPLDLEKSQKVGPEIIGLSLEVGSHPYTCCCVHPCLCFIQRTNLE
jgi:hypothetical protein